MTAHVNTQVVNERAVALYETDLHAPRIQWSHAELVDFELDEGIPDF